GQLPAPKPAKRAQAGENATADEKPAEPLDPRKAAVASGQLPAPKPAKRAQAGENATADEKPAEPLDPRKA
ncbi:electron transporter RnfC, partial [Cronobacter malonaticus]|uniref:electron transporter RnfC n=1 Tax=Cronobacter malonaticus TaxID=413503 RepID=UPI001F3F1E39